MLELSDFRHSALRRQVESLMSSLQLADGRIARQNEMLSSLGHESDRMDRLMRGALSRAHHAEMELQMAREQHGRVEEEATEFRARMKKVGRLEIVRRSVECDKMVSFFLSFSSVDSAPQAYAVKEEEATELEKEKEKMTAKAIKYRETTESLQDAIKEHQRVQEELQAKLKAESKSNAGERESLVLIPLIQLFPDHF